MKRLVVWVLIWLAATTAVQAQLTPEQHKNLVDYARWLGSCRIRYSQRWKPPGESLPWTMDCSNTARFIYYKVLGYRLERTASDQYYILKQKGLVFDAPLIIDGKVDSQTLLSQMRSGDLLFWEWTYNIKRTPPVSHVMIYLGKTADGTPKMVGSASSAAGERTSHGGVDVYTFDPNASHGGVKNFFGQYIHKARFVGYGRPLANTKVVAASTGKSDSSNPASLQADANASSSN